jgi:predicted RNA-binding protein with PUA-like domain
MKYWLMKTEPDEVSIDDLARLGAVPWFGVRNYQARNFMRDHMQVGDPVLVYHSSCPEPGIAGLGEVSAPAFPDATQFDKKSKYYDAGSKPEAPRWLNVEVKFVRKTRLISLAELRETVSLADLVILRRGNRLSITPVELAHWRVISRLLAA